MYFNQLWEDSPTKKLTQSRLNHQLKICSKITVLEPQPLENFPALQYQTVSLSEVLRTFQNHTETTDGYLKIISLYS